MAISDYIKSLLNNMSKTGVKVQLGTIIQNSQNGTDVSVADDAVSSDAVEDNSIRLVDKRDKDYVDEDFSEPAIMCGLATDTNIRGIITPSNYFQAYNIGDATLDFVWQPGELEIPRDLIENEGFELTVDGSATGADCEFTVGTDDCYVEMKTTITDVSGCDECMVGLRKVEAFRASKDDYDEMVAMNVDAGAIKILSILNNGATDSTDTTDAITDGQYAKLRIECVDGVCTFTLGANSATLVAPSTTAAFTFDTGEKVIPFIRFLHTGDFAETTTINSIKFGKL